MGLQLGETHTRESRTAAERSAAALTVSCCAAALALLSPWLAEVQPSQAILLSVQLILCVCGFVRGFFPAARPVQTVLFGFILSYLCVAPIYQLAHRRAAWGDRSVLMQGTQVWWALAIIVVSTSMLLFGFELARARRGALLKRGRAQVRRGLPWLYVVLCVALTPRAVTANGGFGAMFSTRQARADALTSNGISLAQSGGASVALVSTLPTALALAAAVLFLIRLWSVDDTHWLSMPTADVHGFALAIVLLIVYANPFINTRFVTAGAVGCLLLLVIRPRSTRAGLLLAVVVMLGTLLAYPLANIFRYEGARVGAGMSVLAGPDFDGFQQLVNTVDYYQEVGHSWGIYSLSALLHFIPRSIWADKATPASIDVAEYSGYIFTNLSLPFPGEMALEFGVPIMAIILGVLGWTLGRLDRNWLVAPDSRSAVLASYAALAVLSVWRGPLGSNGPVYLTVLALVLGGLTARRAPSRGQKATDRESASSRTRRDW